MKFLIAAIFLGLSARSSYAALYPANFDCGSLRHGTQTLLGVGYRVFYTEKGVILEKRVVAPGAEPTFIPMEATEVLLDFSSYEGGGYRVDFTYWDKVVVELIDLTHPGFESPCIEEEGFESLQGS